MPTKIIPRANRRLLRLSIDRSAVFVVILLAVLFALSISAAMTLHPLVDAYEATLQGGL